MEDKQNTPKIQREPRTQGFSDFRIGTAILAAVATAGAALAIFLALD